MNSILDQAAARATWLLRERARFIAQFPPQPPGEPSFPAFSWRQLERQLVDLAPDPEVAQFIRGTLAAKAAQAEWLPAELVLREVLLLAAMTHEEREAQGRRLEADGPSPAAGATGEDSSMS